ncbi:MAG: cholesterol oxidase substrate-binding domain-containing protein [Pyrinomonadaceae bacterium]
MSQSTPSGFPSNIAISQQDYENWSREINVSNLWTCTPESADEIVQVCNWAKDNGYRVRARGIAHGWSPLTVMNQASSTPSEKVILVDLTKSQYLRSMELIPASGTQSARVKVGTGALMADLLGFLEGAPGGQGDAPGYSFPHTPAPGNITVGGALAIGAHGTAIPSPAESFNASYGSLSNQIVEFTAIVFDSASSKYAPVAFKRGQGDDKAFLTHVGRTFMLDATLQVIDNYNLRCQSFMDAAHDWQTIFKAPTVATPIPPDSMAHFLEQSGRVEAIWFPFSSNPWLKVWTNTPQQPTDPSVVVVTGPNNYPFSDNLPDFVTDLFKLLLGVPTSTTLLELIGEIVKWLFDQATRIKGHNSAEAKQLTANLHDISGGLTKQLFKVHTAGHLNFSSLTPYIGQLMALITGLGLLMDKATDLWGASKNTLLYVQDATLRVTANGYAVHLRRADVQQAVSDFANKFQSMLQQYQSKKEFPINSPLEIRVTALDDPSKVSVDSGMTAQSPVISALSMDQTDRDNGWDTSLWLDVLTLPKTPSSYAFYAELEDWVSSHFTQTPGTGQVSGKVLPEWSKGWAYTAEDGAWTNTGFMQSIRQTLTNGRSADDNWDWEVATLKKYDPHNLFSNPFLDQLMTPV